MPSHSLARLNINDWEILGYSASGEETVVAMPQLDVCFDIGKAPDQVIPINNLLLTHGHMDHSAGIAYYLSHRLFAGQSPGTVLTPEYTVKPIQNILDAFGKLDGNKIEANIIPVKPGDEYEVKPNIFARVFPTSHCRGSVGYCLIEKRRKLKPEYLQLNSRQIVELKKQNIEIDREIEIPLVTYFGDTRYEDYSQLEYIKNCKILIIECTFFLEEHLTRADAGYHMHIDDFAKLITKLNNEHIIITHLTKRTGIKQVKAIFEEKLPPEINKKITLLMAQRRRY
jgi:ribonuclease Z